MCHMCKYDIYFEYISILLFSSRDSILYKCEITNRIVKEFCRWLLIVQNLLLLKYMWNIHENMYDIVKSKNIHWYSCRWIYIYIAGVFFYIEKIIKLTFFLTFFKETLFMCYLQYNFIVLKVNFLEINYSLYLYLLCCWKFIL